VSRVRPRPAMVGDSRGRRGTGTAMAPASSGECREAGNLACSPSSSKPGGRCGGESRPGFMELEVGRLAGRSGHPWGRARHGASPLHCGNWRERALRLGVDLRHDSLHPGAARLSRPHRGQRLPVRRALPQPEVHRASSRPLTHLAKAPAGRSPGARRWSCGGCRGRSLPRPSTGAVRR
jgi:hypothetical protein